MSGDRVAYHIVGISYPRESIAAATELSPPEGKSCCLHGGGPLVERRLWFPQEPADPLAIHDPDHLVQRILIGGEAAGP